MFEEIYYPTGEFAEWERNYINSDVYEKKGRDISNDNRSRIAGRSVFSPRIIKVGDRYFLTLDSQGSVFDHHFNGFLDVNKDIREIDITDMPRDEVMAKVKEMLSMSNEAIMKEFNIKNTYSNNVKMELLLEDVIYDYLEDKGLEIGSRPYANPENGIRLDYGDSSVLQHHKIGENENKILLGRRILSPHSLDKIYYDILNESNDANIDEIRVKINEDLLNVNTELGNHLLQTLRERFVDKELGEEAVGTIETDEHVEDLNELSVGALKDLFDRTRESNEQKRQELIALIIEEQHKGLQLDALLKEAREETRKKNIEDI